jgi:RNase P/RNase MRP subunit p30
LLSTYVDLNVRPYRNVDLNRVLRIASKLGYVAVAVEGVDVVSNEFNGLKVLPRVTYKYVGKPTTNYGGLRNHLIVYEIDQPTMIKALTSLRGRCHLIRIARDALTGIKKKHINALKSCKIPIELSVKDLISNNSINYTYLKNFFKLLPYIERGDIELVVSSYAGDEYELIHPLQLIALLKELGLSELIATKALTGVPMKILRMVGSGV